MALLKADVWHYGEYADVILFQKVVMTLFHNDHICRGQRSSSNCYVW